MHILTAHRILIAIAVVFFAFYALREALRFASSGSVAAALGGILSALAAIGFALYWRRIPRA
jgi:hypothetical protein